MTVQFDGRKEQDSSDFEQISRITATSNSDWVKFSSSLVSIHKQPGSNRVARNDKYYQIIDTIKDSSEFNQGDSLNLWFDSKDLICKCPKIKMNRKYLIMTNKASLFTSSNNDNQMSTTNVNEDDYDYYSYEEDNTHQVGNSNSTTLKTKSALIDHSTIIIEWKNLFTRRLKRLSNHLNRCM